MKQPTLLAVTGCIALTGCSADTTDPRGVDRSETLLSVSASGEADTRPDEAQFQAGVQNWGASAAAASEATQDDIAEIVQALRALGIAEDDIQTSAVGVQRLDYGDREGQFQATNTLTVSVRDIDKASAAVTAVTGVGANIVSGPDLRLSDPEAAANSAYANAYAAARRRAEAYAEAADMEISRVLYIRDTGGSQGNRYIGGAQQIAYQVAPPPVAPPPPVAMAPRPEEGGYGATIMPGQTTSSVTVQVDFALTGK